MKAFVPFLALAVFLVAALTPASAQQPGFDLAAALAAAQPGETVIVPAGVYPGPLVIDRSLKLVGEGRPVIQGDGQGNVIEITAPDVTFAGFVVRGSGDSIDREDAGILVTAPRAVVADNRLEDVLFGIYLQEAPDSTIRANTVLAKDLPISRRGDGVKIWYSHHSLIEGNHVQGSRDILFWFSPDSIIRDNIVEDGRYGMHFMQTSQQLVENNILRRNAVGIYLMYGRGFTLRRNLMQDNHGPSGYGLGLKDVDDVVVEGNRMISNRLGVYVDNSPVSSDAFVRFENNLFAYNEIGANLLPLVQRNTYTQNIFQDNGEQIAIQGGGELLGNQWSDESGLGNFWSDYAGFDADGDRVGDIPYQSISLYENLMALYPELRLFQLSPAADALDFAATAFPLFQPRAKMSDERPLMAPPSLPLVPGLSRPPFLGNALAAFAMLFLAGLILLSAARSHRLS